MGKLLMIILASLIICSCTDRMAELPEYLEYSPGKWVAFNKSFKLEWSYDEAIDTNFNVSKVKVKPKKSDIRKIKKMIRKKDIYGLDEKEKLFRTELNFAELIECNKSTKEMNYRETKDSNLNFDEMYLYQVRAVKDNSTSLPSVLSVIFIERSH